MRLEEAMSLLANTPQALDGLLRGLPEPWLVCNEGDGTWNAREVVAHLIEAERTNWLPRLARMLQEHEAQLLPFDRFAHMQRTREPTIAELLDEFREVRASSLAGLQEMIGDRAGLAANAQPTAAEALLSRAAIHPEFGRVTARELIATWAVHDLTHLSQILRVMAGRYRTDVGPWAAYLGILQSAKK